MTFEQYCALIETTARVHGYHMFLPSLYDSNSQPGLHVFDYLPACGSDEQVAKAWAASFMKGQPIFLAYRGDVGVINVCEYLDSELTRKRELRIESGPLGACG